MRPKKKRDGRKNNGGARKGAGRPETAVVVRTRRVAKEALTNGKITPLEVMLDNMYFWHLQGQELTDRLREIVVDIEDEESVAQLMQDIRNIAAFREKAQDCAVDCAPYMHPRLANIQFKAEPNVTSKAITKDMDPKIAAENYAELVNA